MITAKPFGKTKNGAAATLYTITAGAYAMRICDFGATLVSLVVPDQDAKPVDVLLGFDDVTAYEGNIGYMGATIGRFGNRIARGQFSLNGTDYQLFCNDGPNHLHGGAVGFNHRMFTVRQTDDRTLAFSYLSPDGEENFPGNLHFTVTYSLNLDGCLTICYDAVSDADTIANFTNHSYFNLNGAKSGTTIFNHTLSIHAEAYCVTDENALATGEICPVENTCMDLREPVLLDKTLHSKQEPIASVHGIDHNFVLSGQTGMRTAATLTSPATGITMVCATDQPGVQLYTGNMIDPLVGKGNVTYGHHSALCLETQGFPNAINCPNFPSCVLKKDQPFHTTTTYTFSVQ